MIGFIIKKVCILLATFLAIVSLTFFLMKIIPGDPFSQERAMAPEVQKALKRYYGLDDPLHIQYFRYLKSIATGDLGPSLVYKGRSVNAIIGDGFPISALLACEAMILSIGAGLFLGTAAALHHKDWVDNLTMTLAVIGISVPNFILATLLQYILALKLEWLPIARWGSFSQSILPALSLAALPTAYIARLTRSNLLDVLSQDYIKTALAKGLKPLHVLFHHALRNSILPIFTYCSQLSINILVGSFVIEKIFAIPGLGQWMVNAVSNRDYPLIMGTTVLYSSLLLVGIFLMDLLYAWVDPRICSPRENTQNATP